jgi:hypothetical protein
MRLKGVSYDVGRVMGLNWRPDFDPKVIHRELAIIKNDLHCNAVRICGLDIDRLMVSAEDALKQGLEVWLTPEMWDKTQEETLKYIIEAATEAEKLRVQYPDKLVFLVGSEFTLFMQGIVEGDNIVERMAHPDFWETIKTGGHNKKLNTFLANATSAVRQVFHGKVTYASILWEDVDWSIFDFVGIDHYRMARIKEQYIELLKPAFTHDKPVVITEFGYRTYQGADESTEGMAGDIVDHKSLYLHQLPLLGNFVKPQIRGSHVRDENFQAKELVDQLIELDKAGVDGAFIMTFVSPINPYDENPKYDLDMASYSLVKSYSKNRHGTTYVDMTWEPKESFKAVAEYYASH